MAEILKTYDPRAEAQEAKVNKAYAEYEKAAAVVAKLYNENGEREPDHTHPAFDQWRTALMAKRKAHETWQREQFRHGDMFVTGV